MEHLIALNYTVTAAGQMKHLVALDQSVTAAV